MILPNSGKPESLDSILRLTFSLANPGLFSSIVPPCVDALSPWCRERFLHYGAIYKEFIRPLLPTCKVYHHEPVNCSGGVESGPWFAMEYAAPDRSQGWALVVRARNGAGS